MLSHKNIDQNLQCKIEINHIQIFDKQVILISNRVS
jgi:hypothetical protein